MHVNFSGLQARDVVYSDTPNPRILRASPRVMLGYRAQLR